MVKPIKKNVLFMPFAGKEITDGGLFIPENCRSISNKGQIKAVGNEVTKVKVGDIAYRVKDWGTEINENGVDYFLLNEGALLAVD